MEADINILKRVKLFSKMEETDIKKLLTCLGVKTKTASKGELIFTAGSKISQIGVILEGTLMILREGIDGERTVIASISEGNTFGEVFCCAGTEECFVSVAAQTDCRFLLIEYAKIFGMCSESCLFHRGIIENLISDIAVKNLFLQRRIDVLAQRSLRAKILSCLQMHAKKSGEIITLPFNREELADFICADRSAVSHELIRMKKDGILDYHKSSFRVL